MKGMQRNASDWKEPESGGELEYEWAQGPTLVSNDIVDLCAVPLRGQLSFENAAQAEATFQARSEKIKSKRRSNWDEWNAEQKRIRTEGDKDGKRRSTRAATNSDGGSSSSIPATLEPSSDDEKPLESFLADNQPLTSLMMERKSA
jgi:hypothetical protein